MQTPRTEPSRKWGPPLYSFLVTRYGSTAGNFLLSFFLLVFNVWKQRTQAVHVWQFQVVSVVTLVKVAPSSPPLAVYKRARVSLKPFAKWKSTKELDQWVGIEFVLLSVAIWGAELDMLFKVRSFDQVSDKCCRINSIWKQHWFPPPQVSCFPKGKELSLRSLM